MAFDLNPVAVSAAPLLRAIQIGGWADRTELAEMAGRLRNHIARDIGVLVKAGLVEEQPDATDGRPLLVTDAGRAQLAALDRAADPSAGSGLSALLADLQPHPLNPRKDFDSDDADAALNELRESILLRGLMQPLVVRPGPEAGMWWIVDGERRYRAIQQANWDGDWADDKPVPIVAREVDDREHLLLSLTANLQRADMSAIEEAVAFNAAVHDFGLTTEALADELGKSQRYVQQRIALLKLSADDQDRMRLPRDHPDRLSFKAARALSQTPREAPLQIGVDLSTTPDMSVEVEGIRDDQGRMKFEIVGREPGSPPPETTPQPATDRSFGRDLTDREALLFVEIADKADRDPADDPALAADGYTQVQAVPVQGAAAALVARNALGFRQRGLTTYAVPRLHSTGAKTWLEEIGFYAHRDDVLFEMRVRAVGMDAADQARAEGRYVTPWLNPAEERPQQEVEDQIEKVWNTDQISYAREQGWSPEADRIEPEQPALIEETDEERQARQAAVREREAVARDRVVVDRMADEMMGDLAKARARGGRDWPNVEFGVAGNFGPADLVEAAFTALATGDAGHASACLAVLVARRGSMGAKAALAQIPLPSVEKVMLAARVAKTDPNRGTAAPADETDPVEDFVQAEIDDADAALGGDSSTETGQRHEPAVAIRKSITPDYIVCLEDGRRFKSLKRHLRTNYNLSPEEYRAKWGLVRDYPMVAPNYAKARADLARQMGLREPS